jgi:hypothetical protein
LAQLACLFFFGGPFREGQRNIGGEYYFSRDIALTNSIVRGSRQCQECCGIDMKARSEAFGVGNGDGAISAEDHRNADEWACVLRVGMTFARRLIAARNAGRFLRKRK